MALCVTLRRSEQHCADVGLAPRRGEAFLPVPFAM